MSSEEKFMLKAYNAIIGKSQNVRATSNALHVLIEEQAATHDGYAYQFGVKFALAPSGVTFFAATPNSYHVHWIGLSVAAITGPVEIDFYKDSVVGSGTQQFPYNRQLEVSSSCSARVEAVNVLTTTGTLVIPQVNLATEALGGRDNPASQGSLFSGFVLPSSGTYSVGLFNTSADSSDVWVNFAFTEPRNL